MEKPICWANTEKFEDSEVVILGIPDESQSHSLRKGSSEGPHFIREISNVRDSYTRKGEKTLGLPYSGIIEKKVIDYGDISKDKISETLGKIISGSKIPISLGGDHSNTTSLVKAISKEIQPISLVYFDAHPDFVGTTTNYYGSVVHDLLPNIDIKKSIQIGIRTPELEELENIKKHGMKVITPFDIAQKGLDEITQTVLQTIGENVYISFDMDCIDPAYAPGVSVPVPLGLESVDAIHILKNLVKKGIVGMDIMEVCPSYDIKDRTSHLASRMIGEVLSSLK